MEGYSDGVQSATSPLDDTVAYTDVRSNHVTQDLTWCSVNVLDGAQ